MNTNQKRKRPEQAALIDGQIEALEPRMMLSATVGEVTYDPTVDPAVGFNLASFSKQRGKEARTNWENGIQSLHDAGIDHLTINVYREVSNSNGRIIGNSGTGNDVLKVALAKANELGMTVTISPLFEVEGAEDAWRGAFDPDGSSAKRFQRGYSSWIKKLARTAEKNDVANFNVGSELTALMRNADNSEFFSDLISDTDQRFSGDIGYVANWDNLSHPIVNQTIWQNGVIDYMGVSAYFSTDNAVVSVDEALNSASNPDFVDDVQAGWENILDDIVIPVANAAHDGNGIPIVIAEFGAVPFDLTSINPWSTNPGEYLNGTPGETVDSGEQAAMFAGLLRALDGRRDEIESVDFWTWAFEGNPSEVFGLGHDAAPEAQQATNVILDFVNGMDE